VERGKGSDEETANAARTYPNFGRKKVPPDIRTIPSAEADPTAFHFAFCNFHFAVCNIPSPIIRVASNKVTIHEE
jgi:hypothetical protein